MSDQIRDYYNRYHKSTLHYDEGIKKLDKRIQFINKFIKKDDKILEYGCGEGLIIGEIKKNNKLNKNIFGFDISEEAVKKAKKRYPSIKFGVIPETGKLPFKNGTFDVLVCTEVIEHIMDVERTLAEFNRLLKPNGLLLLTTGYHGWIKDLLIVLFFRHELHFHNPYSSHIRFFSKKSMLGILNDFGFKKKYYKGIYKLPLVREMMTIAAEKKRNIK
ncbi:MAG: class I SAM-dependent methyltransferase [Spirochaetia bacterium]|nr:class I SAM-dependent methyltransferase [Spirochaetia bacterium]